MATITHADDPTTFDTEVLRSTVPVVVDFWAAWCGPCRMVGPELEKLADAHDGALKVVKVDVDANRAIAGQYGIQGIPTIALFRDGQAVATASAPSPEPPSKPTSASRPPDTNRPDVEDRRWTRSSGTTSLGRAVPVQRGGSGSASRSDTSV